MTVEYEIDSFFLSVVVLGFLAVLRKTDLKLASWVCKYGKKRRLKKETLITFSRDN